MIGIYREKAVRVKAEQSLERRGRGTRWRPRGRDMKTRKRWTRSRDAEQAVYAGVRSSRGRVTGDKAGKVGRG